MSKRKTKYCRVTFETTFLTFPLSVTYYLNEPVANNQIEFTKFFRGKQLLFFSIKIQFCLTRKENTILILKYMLFVKFLAFGNNKKVLAVSLVAINEEPSISFLSTFDFFNFYFTTCFNPKQGPLQVSLHFEL